MLAQELVNDQGKTSTKELTMHTECKLENQPLIELGELNSTPVIKQVNYSFIKRSTDILIALAALIALAPLMLITCLFIVLESSGSPLFRQQRVGENGRLFNMWKFRSMRRDSEQLKKQLTEQADVSDGVRFKMKDDPRITRVGQVIRKLSIDELPQLFNVLKGDMSLVGPRPALPDEVSVYTQRQRIRLVAKPGITCIWQVSGRSNISFLKQVEMDIDYIRNASLFLDLQLLLKTIPAVLMAKGAH